MGEQILRTIQIKSTIPDHEYTELCNLMEKQGVFKACGSCDDKWIMVQFDDEIDYLAWLTAMGITKAEGAL